MKSSLDSQKRQYALNEIEGLNYFRSVQWLESIDSTNRSLQSSVRAGSVPLPAILIADRQSAGSGRGSKVWWSPDGCLMFSMAIPLAKGSADQAHPAAEKSTDRSFETQASLLPLRVGFTVAETIDLFVNRTARVKWPNDVYLEDQKVSGILIEVVSAQDSQCNQQVAIIGIGINCQVDFQHASPDLQATATSIHAWARPGAAETSSPESVLLEFLNRWLDQEGRNSSEPDWLLQNWSKRGFLNEMWVEVQQATSSVSGICRGISRQGGLLLEDQKHLLLEVIAGTVVSYHRI